MRALLVWFVVVSANALGAGWTSGQLMHGGTARSYRLFEPKAAALTTLPLVIALHGGGGNQETIEKAAVMSLAAEKSKFLLVYPQGTGRAIKGKLMATWNAGSCCGAAVKKNVDDVGFLRQLVTTLRTQYKISAVYITGHSNGAMMAYRLGCEMADMITAIAPVGGVGVIKNCAPSRPVPTLHIHGSADPCALYDGGKTGGACLEKFIREVTGLPIHLPDVPALAVPGFIKDTWSPLMKATGTPAKVFEAGKAQCFERKGSDARSVVQLCTVTGMGHVWPAGFYGGPCTENPNSANCQTWKKTVRGPSDGPQRPNQDLSGNEYIYDFFRRFP